MADFYGTTRNDVFTAKGVINDFFHMSQSGGDDRLTGGAGHDYFDMGGFLTGADTILGGAGTDRVNFDGANLVVLNSANFNGVEELNLWNDNTRLTIDELVDVEAPFFLVNAYAAFNVRFDGSSVTLSSIHYLSDYGDDYIKTGAMDDLIDLGDSGADSAWGGAGDDVIDMVSGIHAFNGIGQHGPYRLDGGGGDDIVVISVGKASSYAGGIAVGGAGDDTLMVMRTNGTMTVSHANTTGFEHILAGAQAQLVLTDDLFAKTKGAAFVELGGAPEEAYGTSDTHEDIGAWIDASAETDARLRFIGGELNDTFIGGARGDVFQLDNNSLDSADGRAGDDLFLLEYGYLGQRELNGGDGFDEVRASGNIYAVFQGGELKNVELIRGGGSIQLTLHNGNVLAGGTLRIVQDPGVDAAVIVDGSRELDGALIIESGVGHDSLTGGGAGDSLSSGESGDVLAGGGGGDTLLGGGGGDRLDGGDGADLIIGGSGGDRLTGGGGVDQFRFLSIADSAPAETDLILDLADSDVISLWGIDANANKAGNQAFNLVDHLSGKAAQAALTYDKQADLTHLALDVNGDGVADAVIDIAGKHADFTGFAL